MQAQTTYDTIVEIMNSADDAHSIRQKGHKRARRMLTKNQFWLWKRFIYVKPHHCSHYQNSIEVLFEKSLQGNDITKKLKDRLNKSSPIVQKLLKSYQQ